MSVLHKRYRFSFHRSCFISFSESRCILFKQNSFVISFLRVTSDSHDSVCSLLNYVSTMTRYDTVPCKTAEKDNLIIIFALSNETNLVK